MADEDQEIISRPPSHPIATTLIMVSIVGTIAAIAFVWVELFGEYLPTPPPGQRNDSKVIAERHLHDHYKEDFGAAADVLAEVEKELGISATVGDNLGLNAGN